MKLYEVILTFIYIFVLPILAFIFAVVVSCFWLYQFFIELLRRINEITKKKIELDKINDIKRRI